MGGLGVVRVAVEVAPRLVKKTGHRLHEARGQQVAQVLLRQLQQQRFLGREVRHRHAARPFLPPKTEGLAAVVALNFEFLAEGLEHALDGAQVAFHACALELGMQLFGGDLVLAGDAAQHLKRQQQGFQGVGACGHVSGLSGCWR